MKKNGKWLRESVLAYGLLACMAAQAQSQVAVNLHLTGATLKEVVTEIRKQAHVDIVYSNEDIRRLAPKNYNMEKASIGEVIDYALGGSNLTYEIKNGVIVIRQKSGDYITGRVVDNTGEPIPGVSVLLTGTSHGTTTNENGEFSLRTNKPDSKVTVRLVGMKTQELTWRGKPLRILMEEDTKTIDEVVVTGYQTIDRRMLTSSVSTVKAEDILRSDVSSIDKMLEGQVPDLISVTPSGEVGVAPRIRIRGTSTLIGNREPLWVVDGIVLQDPVNISPEELNDPDYINRIGNAIAGLNPQDIERLDVLKDAAATALYGTRAANGVIVITTKRGRVGKPTVRYSMNVNMKRRPRYSDRSIDVMNSKDRIQLSRELYNDEYIYPSNISMVGYEGALHQLYTGQINQAQFNTLVDNLETMNTDWFDLLTDDSFSHSHTVSIDGGSEPSRYYASVGYNRDNDVVKGNHDERYTAILNLDTEFNRWLSASFGLNANVNERSYYQDEIAPIEYAYNTSRAIPAYDANGNLSYYQKMRTYHEGYNYNILNELANSSYDQEGSTMMLTGNLIFKFTDWLKGNAIFSYTASNTNMESYWGANTYHVAVLRGTEFGVTPEAGSDSQLPQGGELTRNDVTNRSWTARFQLDANKFLGSDKQHNIQAGVGYEASSTRYKGYQNTTRGYFPERGKQFVSNIDLNDYPAYMNWMASNVPTITDNLNNIMSGYATFSYSYKYFFTGNVNARVDGSNAFGDRSNEKFSPIWSVSAIYNISEHPFLRSLRWIDYINLKSSYGYQGNMLDTESPVMTIRKGTMNSYFGEYESTVNTRPNPNLKWERTNSFNLGLEFSLFERRLQVEAEMYLKTTKDAFMNKVVSSVNGTTAHVVNGGDVTNNGFNVAVTVSPVITKDWRWTISTIFSKTYNKLKTSPAGETYELEDFLTGNALVDGQPVGTFYSYKFLGLSPVDGGPLFDDYADSRHQLEGLDKYDTYTTVLTPSGCREPKMSGSFNTTLRYKQFHLSALFTYSLGAKTRQFGMFGNAADETLASSAYMIRPENNVNNVFLNRWKHPGDEMHTNIPAIIPDGSDAYYKYNNHYSTLGNWEGQFIANNYWDMYDYSDIRVVSANYLKLNSLTLSYELPERLIKRLAMSRLEVRLSGYNLFTVCAKELKGQTPQQGGFTTIQLSDRPSYSLGINVSF